MDHQTTPASLLLAAILVLSGCDEFGGGGDEYQLPLTEIIRIEVSPEEIHDGDQVMVPRIVADSLNAELEYIWLLGPGLGNDRRTQENTLTFIAPPGPKHFVRSVMVTNPNNLDLKEVSDRFVIDIKP